MINYAGKRGSIKLIFQEQGMNLRIFFSTGVTVAEKMIKKCIEEQSKALKYEMSKIHPHKAHF